MSYRYEKSTGDIVISGWEEGVTDNPYEGIYDMRNCDAVTIPGEVSVAMGTQAMQTAQSSSNVAFTYDHTTGRFQYTFGTANPQVNQAITFSNSGGALPAGLTANTAYYVLAIISNISFTISTSAGGSQYIPSDNGSGTNTFSTINMATPKYFANTIIYGQDRAYFMLDSLGRAWALYDVTANTPRYWVYMNNRATEDPAFPEYGNGLVAWHNYLFVFTTSSVNAINLYMNSSFSYSYITTNANWVSNWQQASGIIFSTGSHYAMVSINDDSIYFCNGQSVGLIAYDTSAIDNPNQVPFNIGLGKTVTDGSTSGTSTIVSATMGFTSAHLGATITGTNIPANSYIIHIYSSSSAQIGDAYGNPVNTTGSGTSLTFTIPQTWVYSQSIVKINSGDRANCLGELGSQLMIGGINNYIYPWDRISPNFSTPIFLSENFISRLVTVNTTMYIFCGYKGRIFVTNGANATPFYKIPDYLSLTTNPYFIWTDACFNRNQLYFGFQVTNNAGTTLSTMGGLWAVDVDSGQPTAPRLQNIMSYGTYAGYVSAICTNRATPYEYLSNPPQTDGYGLFMGWYDGVSTSNIDIGISAPYLSGQSFVDTDPVPIGQYLTEKTLSGLEYKLGQPLASGESVAIAYRTQLSGNYTDNPLDTYITGNVSGWGVPIFEKSQWVQFRVTLTSTATNPSYCRVREIRLHLT
jgi:hypothetical protein